jgi:Cu/Ag efflux protein CusF
MNGITMCATAAMLMTAAAAGAQVTKTIEGEKQTVTATVEAIERSSREVTVKKSDGNYEVIYVSPDIKRFDTLKVGDKIRATYYETMVLQLKSPGDKDIDKAKESVSRTEGRASGTAAHQQTITATITAIDPKTPSITFTGPRNWTYSSRVEDRKALAKVKVGDKVDITWTEAMILSLEDAK